MKAQLVDAHCHFDFRVFDGQRASILEGARAAGISTLVVPGVGPENWPRLRALAEHYPAIRYAPGIHPWWVGRVGGDAIAALEREITDRLPGMVAIGECGLDRLRNHQDKQSEVFRVQIRLAQRHGYPLLIHSVRSHDEVGALLKSEGFSNPFLLHGFSGSWEQAMGIVERGGYIGIGGIITHTRAKKTRDAIRRLPDHALIMETDAPDMPPTGLRKGENTPLNLPWFFDSLCRLRGADPETLSARILSNTERLFMQRLEPEGLHGGSAPV